MKDAFYWKADKDIVIKICVHWNPYSDLQMCLGQTKLAEIAGIFLGASNKNRMIGTTFLLGGQQ